MGRWGVFTQSRESRPSGREMRTRNAPSYRGGPGHQAPRNPGRIHRNSRHAPREPTHPPTPKSCGPPCVALGKHALASIPLRGAHAAAQPRALCVRSPLRSQRCVPLARSRAFGQEGAQWLRAARDRLARKGGEQREGTPVSGGGGERRGGGSGSSRQRWRRRRAGLGAQSSGKRENRSRSNCSSASFGPSLLTPAWLVHASRRWAAGGLAGQG